MKVSVRLEHPGDSVAVREINERAFGGPQEAELVEALRGCADRISLVATLDGRVIGHILFTPVTIEPCAVELRAAGLAPMAVQPEYQRLGVGGQLVRTGLDECRQRGYTAVVVVGHPDYYPRFGFVPGYTRGLGCEYPVPPEAFLVIELQPGALTGRTGLVRYRPEFSAFE